ncbi:hypothetical protein ACFLW0_03510 [Chloroflexota bacterium]
MVEIQYSDYYEEAELTGKTIAEVREQYKQGFGIPDRAKAKLNGKGIARKHEAITVLCDEDELSFEERSRKGLIMVASFLLAMAITGGIFAYTYTTASVTMTVGAVTSDFAQIADNSTDLASYTPFGKLRGALPSGTLFQIIPATGYTGDLEVTVYLANPDELTRNYRYWLMRLQLTDNASSGLNPVDAEMITQVLTMSNGEATFYFPSSNFTGGEDYYVLTSGGSYMALPYTSAGWGTVYSPLVFAQVTQAN